MVMEESVQDLKEVVGSLPALQQPSWKNLILRDEIVARIQQMEPMVTEDQEAYS